MRAYQPVKPDRVDEDMTIRWFLSAGLSSNEKLVFVWGGSGAGLTGDLGLALEECLVWGMGEVIGPEEVLSEVGMDFKLTEGSGGRTLVNIGFVGKGADL